MNLWQRCEKNNNQKRRRIMGFRQKLSQRQQKVNSLVCVGLDPLLEKLPSSIVGFEHDWEKVAHWMCRIVDETAPFASLFKPQRAHYEAISDGEKALRKIVQHIHKQHEDIPVFLDCKRGDIGRTQACYRIAQFDLDGVDGMNFSPYMGKDCMQSLVDPKNPGRAIVGLCYTSNSSAREVQDVRLESGDLYWEFIAKTTLKWAEELGVAEDAGLVMAAAHEYPKSSGDIFSFHLKRVRELVGDKLWFLIPGIGTQGGFIEQTVHASLSGPGSIAINSSSGIIFASSGEDYAEAAAVKAQELNNQIRESGGSL